MHSSQVMVFSWLLLFSASLIPAEEISPPGSLPCFPGAYYRKAVSSQDVWTGIEGVITLPTPEYDWDRLRPNGRPIDNASIYMGGNAGGRQEIDAGLLWEIIREPDGSISRVGKAFRPFWRNEQWNNAPALPQYYYYPGDTMRLSCRVTEPGKMVLTVQLLHRPDPEGVTDPLPEDWSEVEPISTFTAEFQAWAFAPGNVQEFKRVNAIDQSGNEGKPAQPTKAKVLDARWHEVWLWRGEQRLPFTTQRFTDMRCPNPDHILVFPGSKPENGAETISLYGTPPSVNLFQVD